MHIEVNKWVLGSWIPNRVLFECINGTTEDSQMHSFHVEFTHNIQIMRMLPSLMIMMIMLMMMLMIMVMEMSIEYNSAYAVHTHEPSELV